MARLDNKALFFTTSPRTPAKMIPEIRLLYEQFWCGKNGVQAQFAAALSKADFFEGDTSKSESEFSARDRITRAPKSLGFVDLSPRIALTEAGNAFVYGKRPQEVYLRQLLKFQLPSPYHKENKKISGTFYIRPFLEIMRLIRELEYLTFDELKIFAVQLTDYRKFDKIKTAISAFRLEKDKHKGEYKRFVNEVWTEAVLTIHKDRIATLATLLRFSIGYGLTIHKDRIATGKIKTRESAATTLKNFIRTQKQNLYDYTDACFRYLRYTGLVSIAHRSRSITFFPGKLQEVDYILSMVERKPVFIDDEVAYKAHLFSAMQPMLYMDFKENLIDAIIRIGTYTRSELATQTTDELKELYNQIVQDRKDTVITAQIEKIKSYSLYSEIMDTYDEIISNNLYDAR